MHKVTLTREQLSFLVRTPDGSSMTADVEVTVTVNPSELVNQVLANNFSDDAYSIQVKNIDIVSIAAIKDVVDALTSLDIYFENLEDAIRFKLVSV